MLVGRIAVPTSATAAPIKALSQRSSGPLPAAPLMTIMAATTIELMAVWKVTKSLRSMNLPISGVTSSIANSCQAPKPRW